MRLCRMPFRLRPNLSEITVLEMCNITGRPYYPLMFLDGFRCILLPLFTRHLVAVLLVYV